MSSVGVACGCTHEYICLAYLILLSDSAYIHMLPCPNKLAPSQSCRCKGSHVHYSLSFISLPHISNMLQQQQCCLSSPSSSTSRTAMLIMHPVHDDALSAHCSCVAMSAKLGVHNTTCKVADQQRLSISLCAFRVMTSLFGIPQ